VGGAHRGRPLQAPKKDSIRPTTDRIKGVIFSMLEAEAYRRGFEPDEEGNQAVGLAWPRVLDLFAGSGALGIEALSRGARTAAFVEKDREALQVIRNNLAKLGLEGQAQVISGTAEAAFSRVGQFDLVLVDPPYAQKVLLDEVLARLAAADVLAESAVLVLEQPAEGQAPEKIGPLTQTSTRVHGATRISMFA
jgi:16S rRNA (guanine966-N2)-methyltransferase